MASQLCDKLLITEIEPIKEFNDPIEKGDGFTVESGPASDGSDPGELATEPEALEALDGVLPLCAPEANFEPTPTDPSESATDPEALEAHDGALPLRAPGAIFEPTAAAEPETLEALEGAFPI